jgi:hypothetical protein
MKIKREFRNDVRKRVFMHTFQGLLLKKKISLIIVHMERYKLE